MSATEGGRGRLYVVATPLGNIDDMSPRAVDVLGRVSAIAAEDTRRSGRLLSHFGLKTRLIAYHEHNESERAAALVEMLESGRELALVSDAGTPLISDPGWRLVVLATSRGIPVLTVPGPSAVTAALSVAGLPTDRFVFEGFLPRRATARAERLQTLAAETRTLVFYESVHRVAATLAAMVDVLGGERRAAVSRELTKRHETTRTATLAELAAAVGDDIPLLGEFVIVVAGAAEQPDATDAEVRRVYGLLAGTVSPGDARRLCAAITGASRNRIYRLTQ